LGKKVLKFDQELDISLVGVASPLKDYRLGHFFSQYVWPNIERKEDVCLDYPKQNRTLFFSSFEFIQTHPEQKVYLLSNRSSGAFFIPSLKEFDYLILWTPGISQEDSLDFLTKIKKTPDILEARLIKKDWIKELDRFNSFMF